MSAATIMVAVSLTEGKSRRLWPGSGPVGCGISGSVKVDGSAVAMSSSYCRGAGSPSCWLEAETGWSSMACADPAGSGIPVTVSSTGVAP
jgi:hypothetical protein